MMNILFLEPFYGGSHREFADGLIAQSRHTIEPVTLPARFWKWRMRGAAIDFARRVAVPEKYDVLMATDLMSVADLKAIWGRRCPPVLLYFHENQFSYPLAPTESMDVQFGFTNITSALAADRVCFNSRTHYDAYFSSMRDFLNMMPDCRPRWILEDIRAKSSVCYPGCAFPKTDPLMEPPARNKAHPPIIVWNHRWEHDKNPEAFFEAIDGLKQAGLNFQLALLGENFQRIPEVFVEARHRYKKHIVRYGYEASRTRYMQWLLQGGVVISTARQENFGLAVVMAVSCGCYPLLPKRLSYPEIIPKAFHADVLYADPSELTEKLIAVIKDFDQILEIRTNLAQSMQKFSWQVRIGDFDKMLEELAQGKERRKV
jgi:glycosyltransferase involved in cell wall biosynthesis